MVSEVTKTTKLSVGLRRIVAGILLLSFIALVVSVLQAGIVPERYLWIGLPIYGVVTAAIIWGLVSQKSFGNIHTGVLIALGVVALVITAVNIYVISTARAFDSLTSSVQSRKSSYVEYVIAAYKDHNTSLSNAQSIGMLSADPLYNKVTKAVKDETSANQQALDSLAELKNKLESGDLQLATIRKANIPIIEEADKTFHDNLVVLRTIRVEGGAAKQSSAINVDKPYVLYISGIDTAGKISTVSRSDVNILMVVNPAKHSILLVNTPRDYYVQLHGTTGLRDKLTHAGVYGVDMSVKTLEDLYGINIQHYIRINFTSLVTLIDAIGPIEAYSDYDFKSYHQGYNTLDSRQALEFSRERYSFQEGDRQRGRNQQHVIEAIIAKLSRTENAVKLPQIVGTIRDSIETDLSEQSIKSIIRKQLDDIHPWKVESTNVDGPGAMELTYSYNSTPLYVMVPSDESVNAAKAKISAYLQQ